MIGVLCEALTCFKCILQTGLDKQNKSEDNRIGSQNSGEIEEDLGACGGCAPPDVTGLARYMLESRFCSYAVIYTH